MNRKFQISTVLLTAAIAGGSLFHFTRAASVQQPKAAAPMPTIPVVASVVTRHDVPIYLTGVGTVIAYNTDVVRAQI